MDLVAVVAFDEICVFAGFFDCSVLDLITVEGADGANPVNHRQPAEGSFPSGRTRIELLLVGLPEDYEIRTLKYELEAERSKIPERWRSRLTPNQRPAISTH